MKSCPSTSSDSETSTVGRVTELSLVLDALRRIRQNVGLSACCEVPLLGRCVDLAYAKGKFIVTVEFKLRDWRRGLVQARDHLLGADFAYICMPKRTITDRMRGEFIRAGVGLMFYREKGNWPFETVIEAAKSEDTWVVARSALLQHILSDGGKRT